MQNWERSEFDEQWKDAFTGAEVAPSGSVWANVDRELTLADNNEGKRRVIFYQRLAAACVLFAVMAGTFGVYYWKQSEITVAKSNSGKTPDTTTPLKSPGDEKNVTSPSQVTENNKTGVNLGKTVEATTQAKQLAIEKNDLPQNQTASVVNPSTENTVAQSIKKNSPITPSPGTTTSSSERAVAQLSFGKTDDVKSQSNSSTIENIASQQQGPTKNSANEDNLKSFSRDQKSGSTIVAESSTAKEKIARDDNGNSISSAAKDESQNNAQLASSVDLPGLELLPIAEIQGEPRFVEIYRRLPYIPSSFMNESRSKKFEHEKLWASVTAASGTYAESSGSSFNSYAAAKASNIAALQSSTQGNAFNLSNSSGSNGAVPTVGKSYSYGVIGGVRLAERWVLQTGVQYMNQSMGTSPAQYSNYGGGAVTSTNEFVSIPVQAGYLLINRKIGWQLNPGLSSDFFVRNTTGNQQVTVTQGAGTDSPYRSVNFAGLMSSEFSYKLGKNYRLSLVPGMRYSFNPALKSVTTGNAIAWDVGFRFRYIFK